MECSTACGTTTSEGAFEFLLGLSSQSSLRCFFLFSFFFSSSFVLRSSFFFFFLKGWRLAVSWLPTAAIKLLTPRAPAQQRAAQRAFLHPPPATDGRAATSWDGWDGRDGHCIAGGEPGQQRPCS